MDKYIYEVVKTEQQDYQEAKPGRNILFDFEDSDIHYFTSAINVVRFIYGMAKCHDRIFTHENNTAYEFCQTYGCEYPSEQLLRELEEQDGGYWFTVQENYDPSKDDEFPSASLCGEKKSTRYYHVMKIFTLDSYMEERCED